jgi:hypothetical protein
MEFKITSPNDPYWTIPEFGKALGDARVVIYTMTQFSESTNPFRKRLPAPLQRSNFPGYVVHMPDPAFVTARKWPDQATDQDLYKVYDNALIALYQMEDSTRLYLLHDEMKTPGATHSISEWTSSARTCTRKPEAVSRRLLEGTDGTPANEQIQRGKTALGIYSK